MSASIEVSNHKLSLPCAVDSVHWRSHIGGNIIHPFWGRRALEGHWPFKHLQLKWILEGVDKDFQRKEYAERICLAITHIDRELNKITKTFSVQMLISVQSLKTSGKVCFNQALLSDYSKTRAVYWRTNSAIVLEASWQPQVRQNAYNRLHNF